MPPGAGIAGDGSQPLLPEGPEGAGLPCSEGLRALLAPWSHLILPLPCVRLGLPRASHHWTLGETLRLLSDSRATQDLWSRRGHDGHWFPVLNLWGLEKEPVVWGVCMCRCGIYVLCVRYVYECVCMCGVCSVMCVCMVCVYVCVCVCDVYACDGVCLCSVVYACVSGMHVVYKCV